MEKTKFKLLVLVVVIAVVSMACGFSATTANIKEAYMAKDEAGTEKTTVYPQKIGILLYRYPCECPG